MNNQYYYKTVFTRIKHARRNMKRNRYSEQNLPDKRQGFTDKKKGRNPCEVPARGNEISRTIPYGMS